MPIVEGDDFERRKKENGKGGIHHAMCNEIDGWANKPSRNKLKSNWALCSNDIVRM